MSCQLRPWRMGDASALAAILNNQKILDNLRDGIPFPYTLDDAQSYIAGMLAADPHQTYAFAITVNDQVVGSIGAFRKDNIHSRTAEMGYYVAESHWRQGIASGAIAQICRHIFDTTDILRIFAEPFAYNIGSCAALEKCGFVREGVLRKNAVKNGRVLDMILYSLISEETRNT